MRKCRPTYQVLAFSRSVDDAFPLEVVLRLDDKETTYLWLADVAHLAQIAEALADRGVSVSLPAVEIGALIPIPKLNELAENVTHTQTGE